MSDDWLSASRNFGIALAASPSEAATFLWESFTLYVDRISRYFRLYSFTSVLEYDTAFRKQQRASNLPWEASNDYVRDMLLMWRISPSLPSSNPTPTIPKSAPKCNDFQTGCCNRANCCYSHKCSRRATSWPMSASGCVCTTTGVLPQGAVLPPGVIFGQ